VSRVAARRLVDRVLRSVRTTTLEGDELANLLYGQQRLGSHAYFTALLGQSHSVPLSAFPHFAFVRDPDLGRARFDAYLDACWAYRRPHDNTPERRAEHIDRYQDRLEKVAAGARRELPAQAVRRRDGRLLIVDGNHRAAIALALGHPVTVGIASTKNWLQATASLGATYYERPGPRRAPVSLFDRSREVVVGTDRGSLRRFKQIPLQDIAGQRVVDLACGIGATAVLAADAGARTVTAVDTDPSLIVAALRLNAYFALEICFELCRDPAARAWEPADTILWFPDAGSRRHIGSLLETVRRTNARVAYFDADQLTLEHVLAEVPRARIEPLDGGQVERGEPRTDSPRLVHRWTLDT
jgi:hypothetical protein